MNVGIKIVILIGSLVLLSCGRSSDPNNGIVFEYYSNGEIKSQMTLKDGVREGMVRNFDDKGHLLSTAMYKNDKRNGELINYSTENGKPMLKAIFVDDVQEGPVIQYYQEGMLFRESTYKKGRIDGIVKTYWPSGRLKAENYYKMGMPSIELKEYDKSGKPVKNQAQIVIEEVNQLALLDKLVVKVYLTDRNPEVEFYLEKLEEGKYLPHNAYKLRTSKGVASIDYFVPRGGTLMNKVCIIAKFKTELNNTMVRYKEYNLSATNRY